MQVSVETTTGLERRLTVGVPAARVDSAVHARLQQAARTVQMKGFRRGKVPAKVVEQRFGDSVRREVIGEILGETFYEAVQSQNLRPAGQPSIEPKNLEPGKDLEYIATFEVYPEITLGEFSGFKIEKPVADVTEADIDTMIENLRKQQGTWEEVSRAAADGDLVNIDFEGTKGGVAFEGGSAQGSDLMLGSKRMIPGFEDGIVGMKAGEEKVLSLSFPADYHSEELKGAAVEFKVKLNKVSERKLAELNDEFFAKYGISEGGLDAFRVEVRKNMERELRRAVRNKIKEQVMEALLASHSFDVPAALINQEIQVLRRQMLSQFGMSPDVKLDDSILPSEMFADQAKKRVSLGLILGEIIGKREIKADPARVRATVEELASVYQDQDEVIKWYYSNRNELAGVEASVLEDQVVDSIVEAAQVSEKTESYDSLLRKDQQG